MKPRAIVLGLTLSAALWALLIWVAITIAHTGLVGALIDGAGRVPFVIWVLLVGCAVLFWIAVLSTTEVITPEQRDEIACRYREYGGKGVTPSTRSTARPAPGGTSQRRPQSGAVGPALGRPDPRRDRQDDIPS